MDHNISMDYEAGTIFATFSVSATELDSVRASHDTRMLLCNHLQNSSFIWATGHVEQIVEIAMNDRSVNRRLLLDMLNASRHDIDISLRMEHDHREFREGQGREFHQVVNSSQVILEITYRASPLVYTQSSVYVKVEEKEVELPQPTNKRRILLNRTPRGITNVAHHKNTGSEDNVTRRAPLRLGRTRQKR